MDQELYRIQEKLKTLGLDPGPLDGIWGTQTRDAVAAALGIKKVQTVPAAKGGAEAPWLEAARALIGTTEDPGTANDASVTAMFRDSVGQVHPDSVPWCAALTGACLKRTGYKGSGSLMARSYLNWGTKLTEPRKGAVVVLERGAAPAGHVGFVERWNATSVWILGGNQSDAVNIKSFPRGKVLGFRWPSEALAA
jgi:uncharacterized protein (TIGR02594 family)